MRAESDDLQVHAYVDGEMHLEAQLRFEERLAGDARLRAQVDALRSLSQSLRAEAQYHAAPADLRAHLMRAAVPVQETRRVSGLVALAGRLVGWRPLVPALALAAIAAVAVNLAVLRTSDAQWQREELVASHVRATLSQRAIDVASSDRHTVKPWFSTQLDFSPTVRELDLPGAALLGGRIDYVQGRRVAVLVYQVRRHVVDHYMWPATGSDSGVELQELRGFRIAQWRQGGLAHRLVSDMDAQELQAVIAASRKG